MGQVPTIMSMTGFARISQDFGGFNVTLEGRSVNARGLDIRLRVPFGFDVVEAKIRAAGTSALSRGNVNATLEIESAAPHASLVINEGLALDLYKQAEVIAKKAGAPQPSLEAVMRLKGVVEASDQSITMVDAAQEKMGQAIGAAFFEALAAARASEGARLGTILQAQVDDIAVLAKGARAQAEAAVTAIQQRLKDQIEPLLADGVPLNPDRLEQEVAVLAVKADIREELDRLDAHVGEARDLLKAAGPVGRRLDFLTQEFNREANTLCSKATTTELKRIGLDLKTVIDQMREQVQNVE